MSDIQGSERSVRVLNCAGFLTGGLSVFSIMALLSVLILMVFSIHKLSILKMFIFSVFIVFSLVFILCTSSELETLKLQLMLDISNWNAAQPWGE